MTDLLSIFASDIFPIFAIAGAGYLLARFVGANVKSVSHVVFYVATPCLVFTLLTTTARAASGMGMVVLGQRDLGARHGEQAARHASRRLVLAGGWKNGPRILFSTGDSRLLALDAKTGTPASTFGQNGEINLRVGVADKFPEGNDRNH